MRLGYLLIVFLVLIVFGCKNNQEEQREKKVLVMAKTSEMALLMNEMYAYNESIKQQIIEGNLSNSYPQRFDNIHSAVLTNPSVRDFDFESFSKQYLEAQKQVFESP